MGLHVVLIEPEIPQNTGSIGRVCLAVGATLHLVEPLGFELTHSRLKRAGLDYWQHLNVQVHSNVQAWLATVEHQENCIFFTKKAARSLFEQTFQSENYLVFGKETAGLPDWIMEEFADQCVRIPIYDQRVRSLNLANAVSVGVYQAIHFLNHR